MATQKLRLTSGDGRQIFHDAAFADTDTVYSEKFAVPRSTVWSIHLYATAASSWSAAFTLWASDKPDPSEADDTDWVQMTSSHGWDGLPGGDPSSVSSFKDLADVGVSGALYYRLKAVNSAGTATLQGIATQKREG